MKMKQRRSPLITILLLAMAAAAAVVVAVTLVMIQQEQPSTKEEAELPQPTPPKEKKPSEKELLILYQEECSGCHGSRREGAMGPALIPETLATISEKELKEIILNGIPNTAMPGWMDVLTKEWVNEFVTFLKKTPVKKEELKWGIEEVWDSLTVITPEAELPSEPAYQADVRDLMLVVERDMSSIYVIDGKSGQELGRIMAGYKTHIVKYDPVNERWAYLISRDGWVFKVDLFSLKPIRKIKVGLNSRCLAISADGKYLIAGNFIPNSAVILDASTLYPLKVIEAYGINPKGEMVESRVGAILNAPENHFALVLQEAGSIWLIDYTKPNFPIVAEIKDVGHNLLGAGLTPDGRYLITGSQTDDFVAVIDLKEKRLIKRIPTGRKPYMGLGTVVEVRGRNLGLIPAMGENKITVIDIEDWEVVKYIFTKGPVMFVASHPHSRYIWASVAFGPNSAAVHIIDKESLEIVATRWPGERSIFSEFTADGKYVYVSVWGEDKVVVYDATTLERVKEFQDVKTPTAIFPVSRRELKGF